MSYLHSRHVKKALCTRNFPAPVHHLLETFLKGEHLYGVFEPVVTRDSEGVKPKPSPQGLWRIAEHWGIGKDGVDQVSESGGSEEVQGDLDQLELVKRDLGSGLIMVGDSMDDMAAGYRAGAATVLLANEENEDLCNHEYTGLSVKRLDDLIQILENGFEERR